MPIFDYFCRDILPFGVKYGWPSLPKNYERKKQETYKSPDTGNSLMYALVGDVI